MTIPNTARTGLISGFPGNISHDGPTRAQSFVLNAGTESNSVFGRAFTVKSAADETVQPGGAGKFDRHRAGRDPALAKGGGRSGRSPGAEREAALLAL